MTRPLIGDAECRNEHLIADLSMSGCPTNEAVKGIGRHLKRKDTVEYEVEAQLIRTLCVRWVLNKTRITARNVSSVGELFDVSDSSGVLTPT